MFFPSGTPQSPAAHVLRPLLGALLRRKARQVLPEFRQPHPCCRSHLGCSEPREAPSVPPPGRPARRGRNPIIGARTRKASSRRSREAQTAPPPTSSLPRSSPPGSRVRTQHCIAQGHFCRQFHG